MAGSTDIYCLVAREVSRRPREALARALAELDIPTIVERRHADRRSDLERRGGLTHGPPGGEERHRVRNETGRRVAERRATPVPVARKLSGKARRLADRIGEGAVLYARAVPTPRELESVACDRAVIRFQQGDQRAFDEIYRRFADLVHQNARMVLNDPHEAQDVAQQVFTKVLQALPRYEVRPGAPIRPWIHTITRTTTIDALKKRAPIELESPERIARRLDTEIRIDKAPALEAFPWDSELLHHAERLAPAQRQVIVMRYGLGLENDEIAAILGRTPDSVRTLQSRAYRLMGVRLEALGHGTRSTRRRPMRVILRAAPVLRARRFALRAR